MKRFWTAVALLFTVIAGGWYNLFTVSDTVGDISVALTQAQQAAQQNQLSTAAQFTTQAQHKYEQHEVYFSAVISEKLLDEVRLGFARTQAGVQTGDCAQLMLELAGLRQAVDDLLRSEVIGLKNIF